MTAGQLQMSAVRHLDELFPGLLELSVTPSHRMPMVEMMWKEGIGAFFIRPELAVVVGERVPIR